MTPAPGMGLRVVSPAAVRGAVGWLARATPGTDWWADDFAGLRWLYHVAAGRSEAVLVGSGYTHPTDN